MPDDQMSPGDLFEPAFDDVCIYSHPDDPAPSDVPDGSPLVFLGETAQFSRSLMMRVLTPVGVGWIWLSNVREM